MTELDARRERLWFWAVAILLLFAGLGLRGRDDVAGVLGADQHGADTRGGGFDEWGRLHGREW